MLSEHLIEKNFTNNVSDDWLESQYNLWCSDPSCVTDDWQLFFTGFMFGTDHALNLAGQSVIDDSYLLKSNLAHLQGVGPVRPARGS